MRRGFSTVILVGVLAAPAAGAANPIVPVKVQRAIVQRTRVYDYLPTRAALRSFRYYDFTAGPHGISVWFRFSGREIGFHSFAQRVPCRSGPGTETGGAMRTFFVNSVRIYWRGTAEDHEAWRCVRAHDNLITLEATDTFFGESALSQRTLRRVLLDVRSLG
jgi:hypothetical protein